MSVASSSAFNTESITVPMEYVLSEFSRSLLTAYMHIYDIYTDDSLPQTISFSSPHAIEEVS